MTTFVSTGRLHEQRKEEKKMATKNLKKMWHQFRRSMSEIENYAFSWH
jgi:hypothetical protein